ncbi:MAG: TerB family tellurite resistance protein [Arenimonas sp.]
MGNPESGMWSQVKEALGGIFGRGLSDERRMEVEVTFALFGFVAKADGLITSYETEFAQKLLDELELNIDGRDLAMAAYDQGRTLGFDVEPVVKRFLEKYPAGSEEMERLFESLLRLALSDDRVYPRERQALERLAAAFEVSVKSLDQRLATLRK